MVKLKCWVVKKWSKKSCWVSSTKGEITRGIMRTLPLIIQPFVWPHEQHVRLCKRTEQNLPVWLFVCACFLLLHLLPESRAKRASEFARKATNPGWAVVIAKHFHLPAAVPLAWYANTQTKKMFEFPFSVSRFHGTAMVMVTMLFSKKVEKKAATFSHENICMRLRPGVGCVTNGPNHTLPLLWESRSQATASSISDVSKKCIMAHDMMVHGPGINVINLHNAELACTCNWYHQSQSLLYVWVVALKHVHLRQGWLWHHKYKYTMICMYKLKLQKYHHMLNLNQQLYAVCCLGTLPISQASNQHCSTPLATAQAHLLLTRPSAYSGYSWRLKLWLCWFTSWDVATSVSLHRLHTPTLH